MVQCFLIEPTDRVELSLRRYRHGTNECPVHGYHDASVVVGVAPARFEPSEIRGRTVQYLEDVSASVPRDDVRWPRACACGFVFEPGDEWQVNQDLIYRRADTGEERPLRGRAAGGGWETVPGAMFDADWDWERGHDGRSLHVVLPDGHVWGIDGEASNCTRKGDKSHRCWLRSGEPPRITVGKSGPGFTTCAAGAGSIGTPRWHGFLIDGVLRSC